MEYISNLLLQPSITQSLLLLTLTITLGIILSNRLRIKSLSLGVTWILFAGICLSHFGMKLNPDIAQFAKDFGLVLFVYSIGLQVGPSFFSGFGRDGLRLNLMALIVVLLGAGIAIGLHFITGEDMATMVGIMSGAVTNTPGLGAAQQAFQDMHGVNNPDIANGYAVAYPLGVIGTILSIMLIKYFFHINLKKEDEQIQKSHDKDQNAPVCFDIDVTNVAFDNQTVYQTQHTLGISMVISRIMRPGQKEEIATPNSIIRQGDTIRIITDRCHMQKVNELGNIRDEEIPAENKSASGLVSKRVVLSKEQWNGKRIGTLNIRKNYSVNISRITRAGVDLLATPDLVLHLGDRIMLVGDEKDVNTVATIFGNEVKRLDIPNLLPIFLGIVLGIVLGMMPITIPGLGQPFKLGLAGGSLIIAILIGRYGPRYHLVTYSTTSANKMIREIGISMFLAAVGLGAGESFIPTIINGGYWWILYGVVITVVPILIMGMLARVRGKLDYFSLAGLIAGSSTNPPALAYASSLSTDNDRSSVAYVTVYPFTMFLRVMVAQLLILLL